MSTVGRYKPNTIVKVVLGALCFCMLIACASCETQDQTAQVEQSKYATSSIIAHTTYTVAISDTNTTLSFINDDGTAGGIEADLLAEIAKDQNLDVSTKVLDAASALAEVQRGASNVLMSDANLTEDERNLFDFSEAYYTSADAKEYRVAVKKGINANFITQFNAGLANIKANGIYDTVLAKYAS